MKQISRLFIILVAMQSMQAADLEQPQTFFQTLRADIRAWIRGEASQEQKERLMHEAGAVILAFSIIIFCIAALGDISNGRRPAELRIWRYQYAQDAPLRKQDQQVLPKEEQNMLLPGELDDLLQQSTPPATSVLRGHSNMENRPLSERARNMQLPTEDPGSPF